ncbi:hypothetical protein D3C80_1254950 [compost metagenome]
MIGRRSGVVLNRRAGLQLVPLVAERPRRAQRQADGRQVGWHPRRHARPVVQLADEHQRRLGMLQNLAHRVGSQVRVQRHRDVPGHPDRQVGNDPVRAVLGNDRDAAALRQFPAAQPVGTAPGLLADIGPAQCLQLTARQRLNHIGLVRVSGFTLIKHLQRQTESIGHRASSFVVIVEPTKQLLGRTIPRTKASGK